MHRNNSFTTHSSEDSIYSSIKKQFSVNVIELYYDSIVFASPELSRPVEKKNELTQEMFKFVSPCDINLHGWEKHEVNYPVRLDTFYN